MSNALVHFALVFAQNASWHYSSSWTFKTVSSKTAVFKGKPGPLTVNQSPGWPQKPNH